jgi:hypothetical protein
MSTSNGAPVATRSRSQLSGSQSAPTVTTWIRRIASSSRSSRSVVVASSAGLQPTPAAITCSFIPGAVWVLPTHTTRWPSPPAQAASRARTRRLEPCGPSTA